MSNIKDIQAIKTLISEGKKQGFLTFEQLGKALPAEFNKADQLDDVIKIFDQLNIAIVNTPEDGKKIMDAGVDSEEEINLTENEEESVDYVSRSTDPVRMYLREMGAVGLLDREGEVVIAKKIENGEMDVLYALVEIPVAIEELISVGEDLDESRIKLKDVVKTIEEDDPSEDEMNQRQRVIFLLDEVKQLYEKKRNLYHQLDDCARLDKKVAKHQNEIVNYKTEIVERLRDIKIEKTSSTRSLKPWATT